MLITAGRAVFLCIQFSAIYDLSPPAAAYQITDDQQNAGKENQPGDHGRKMHKYFFRKNIDDLIIARIEDPVGFAREKQMMEYGEEAGEIDGAEDADDREQRQQADTAPETDTMSGPSFQTNIDDASKDLPAKDDRPADAENPKIQ